MKNPTVDWKFINVKKLVAADWNYKEDDEVKSVKLANNMKKNGIVQNLIVRELGGGKYEVVNGNHRLAILKNGEGSDEVMCCNLGKISLALAKRIAYETNETNFETNQLRLGELLSSIAADFDFADLLDTSPLDEAHLRAMMETTQFDPSNYTNHTGHSAMGGPNSDSGIVYEQVKLPEAAWAGLKAQLDRLNKLVPDDRRPSDLEISNYEFAIKTITKFLAAQSDAYLLECFED